MGPLVGMVISLAMKMNSQPSSALCGVRDERALLGAWRPGVRWVRAGLWEAQPSRGRSRGLSLRSAGRGRDSR